MFANKNFSFFCYLLYEHILNPKLNFTKILKIYKMTYTKIQENNCTTIFYFKWMVSQIPKTHISKLFLSKHLFDGPHLFHKHKIYLNILQILKVFVNANTNCLFDNSIHAHNCLGEQARRDFAGGEVLEESKKWCLQNCNNDICRHFQCL